MSESGEPSIPSPQPAGDDLRAEIDALRAAVERERETLRDAQEQQANQLSEQAARLGESFVTASNLALRGFERAEARLGALEQDMQGRIAQLSRDMQAVVAELRSARPQSSSGPASAFPLESVMRIHEELRESDDTAVSGAEALKAGLSAFSRPASRPTPELPQSTEPSTALTARLESLERAVGEARAAATQPRVESPGPRYSLIGLALVVAALVVFGVLVQRRIDARLNDATVRISAAERQRDSASAQADSRLASARQEAAQQVAEARQSAEQAQIVSNVLAAPDVVRYWLIGQKANARAYARVMFSRSRGMVFSGARLPPVPEGQTYQLWLLTRGGPVSAGLMKPDSAGRITFATDTPVSVPRRLTGAVLTMEPASGAARPGSTSVLVRVP